MMQSFILVGASHAFYLSFVLYRDRYDTSAKILSSYLVVLGLIYSLVFVAQAFRAMEILVFLWNISLLIAPFFLIYTQSVIEQRKKIAHYLYYFVPYFLSLFYLVYLLMFYSDRDLLTIFSIGGISEKPLLYIFFNSLEYICIPVSSICSLLVIQKHQKRIANEFSYTDGIDLNWLRWFSITGLLIWLLVNIPYLFLSYGLGWPEEYNITIGFVVATPMIFVFGYYGYRQKSIFGQKDNVQVLSVGKYTRTGLNDNKRKALAKEIDATVKGRKLYMQNKLSLDDLESCMGYSKHNISETINKELSKSFYEYINTLRVEEFERKVRSGEYNKFTLLAIAYECGFNSKTSFNRIYKEMRGKTPRAFTDSFKNSGS